VTFALVVIIFGVSVYLARPVLDSFLFAVALAVGLIPELLPAIVSVNLAIGAERMARRRVIVKQLASIENFGSMNALCSDKTGALTEGVVRLHAALDAHGKENAPTIRTSPAPALSNTGIHSSETERTAASATRGNPARRISSSAESAQLEPS
jgi:P-type Mg2+ transporter